MAQKYLKPRSILLLFSLSLLFLLAGTYKKILSQQHSINPSPDGNYQIVIFAYPSFTSFLPGQGGDASGLLKVIDLNTQKIIYTHNVSKVNDIPTIEWHQDSIVFYHKFDRIPTLHLKNNYSVKTGFQYKYFSQRLSLSIAKQDTSMVKSLTKNGFIFDIESEEFIQHILSVLRSPDQIFISFFFKEQDLLTKLNNQNSQLLSHLSGLPPEVIKTAVSSGLHLNNDFHSAAFYALNAHKLEQLEIMIALGGTLDCSSETSQADARRLTKTQYIRLQQLLPHCFE